MRNLFLNPLLLSSLALGAALLSGCTGEVLTVEMVDLAGDAATSVPTLDASRAETASHDATHDAGQSPDVGAPRDGTADGRLDGTADAPTGIDAGTHDGGAGDVGPQPDGGDHTDAPIPPPIDAGPGDAPADAPADHNAHDAHEAGGESDASSDGTVPVLIAIHVTIYGLPLNDSVVLQDNHTDTSTVTNSSGSTSFGFDFPTLLPTGSAYDVTAVSSSSAVTCSVVNPTGFAGSVPTTGIYVKCAPPIGTTQTVTVDLTGLAMGEAVTLLLNGGDPLTLTMDGTKAFTTQAAAGYMVTVQTEPQVPIAQTCTVSPTTTSGLVDVNCATDSFTVGGTITGLPAGGKVTLANGAAHATIMANGSFVVGAPVASGQTYDVTVVGSSYACNVVPNTGFGTVGAAPVMSVQIQCGDLAPTQTGDVTGVASDGTNVYWANYTNGSIYSEPVVGGTITTLYSGSQGMGPTGLAIYPATGASVVFWTNSSNGNVMRVTTGANSVVKLIASGPTGATGIAVSPSGNVVYWTNRTSGSVVAASAAGGGTTTTLSTGNNLPTAVVADAANLYWTNFGDATVAGSGGVWRIALGLGGLASTDANGTAEIAKGTTPLGIAVYGANVYWTDPGVGTVWTAPTSATTTGNTAPTPIAMGQLAPWYIATDGTYVYWTCHSTVGTVERALIGGGAGVAPTPLAQNQSSPNFIAVDATNVYWTNDNPSPNGQVDEVPKN